MNEFDKLKIAREALGLSQSELAGILGDVPNAVSKLEGGQKKFVPNKYIRFLGSKNYDLNSLFDDELPLKKLTDDSGLISDPKEKYYKATDKELLNKLINLFGLDNKMQLVEYLAQVNEKGGPANMLEIAALKIWENKYLKKFEWMERRLQLIADTLTDEAANDLNMMKLPKKGKAAG